MKFLHQEMEQEVANHWDALDWIYKYLKGAVLTRDKDRLKTSKEAFGNICSLSRPTFLMGYLGYEKFTDGDSEIVSMRETLLFKIINEKLVEGWLVKHLIEKEKERSKQLMLELPQKEELRLGKDVNLLTLDANKYHPEDKNFKYYQQYSGKELIGFIGSPNLKHSGVVNCAVISPDGKWIISGSDDHTIKLWEVETGKCVKTIPLLWIPRDIKAMPGKPGFFATSNSNGTVTFFDFREILSGKKPKKYTKEHRVV